MSERGLVSSIYYGLNSEIDIDYLCENPKNSKRHGRFILKCSCLHIYIGQAKK